MEVSFWWIFVWIGGLGLCDLLEIFHYHMWILRSLKTSLRILSRISIETASKSEVEVFSLLLLLVSAVLLYCSQFLLDSLSLCSFRDTVAAECRSKGEVQVRHSQKVFLVSVRDRDLALRHLGSFVMIMITSPSSAVTFRSRFYLQSLRTWSNCWLWADVERGFW